MPSPEINASGCAIDGSRIMANPKLNFKEGGNRNAYQSPHYAHWRAALPVNDNAADNQCDAQPVAGRKPVHARFSESRQRDPDKIQTQHRVSNSPAGVCSTSSHSTIAAPMRCQRQPSRLASGVTAASARRQWPCRCFWQSWTANAEQTGKHQNDADHHLGFDTELTPDAPDNQYCPVGEGKER